MGVYPVLTAIALVLEPVLVGMPVPMRTLLMSALMVPIMVYGVMPLISGNNLRPVKPLAQDCDEREAGLR